MFSLSHLWPNFSINVVDCNDIAIPLQSTIKIRFFPRRVEVASSFIASTKKKKKKTANPVLTWAPTFVPFFSLTLHIHTLTRLHDSGKHFADTIKIVQGEKTHGQMYKSVYLYSTCDTNGELLDKNKELGQKKKETVYPPRNKQDSRVVFFFFLE